MKPYVSMAPEMLQQLDLAQSALGQDLFAKDIGDLLDSDALAGRIMNGGAMRQRRESALAQQIASQVHGDSSRAQSQLTGGLTKQFRMLPVQAPWLRYMAPRR